MLLRHILNMKQTERQLCQLVLEMMQGAAPNDVEDQNGRGCKRSIGKPTVTG